MHTLIVRVCDKNYDALELKYNTTFSNVYGEPLCFVWGRTRRNLLGDGTRCGRRTRKCVAVDAEDANWLWEQAAHD